MLPSKGTGFFAPQVKQTLFTVEEEANFAWLGRCKQLEMEGVVCFNVLYLEKAVKVLQFRPSHIQTLRGPSPVQICGYVKRVLLP